MRNDPNGSFSLGREVGAQSPLPTAERTRWQRRAVYAAVGMAWIAAAIAGAVAGLLQSFGPAPLGRDLEVSTLVLDRNGKLLRAYLTTEGRWRLRAMKDQVDPRYFDALLTYEDKRFYHHRGVDPLAMTRDHL